MKKVTVVIAGLFLAAVFTATLESCGKYDEGPSFSIKSKKSRIARAWKVDKYIDGATGSEVSPSLELIKTFTKDGGYTYSVSGIQTIGTWEFSNHKEDIVTTITIAGILSISETSKILRLTSKELWTIDTDGTNDETHYVVQ